MIESPEPPQVPELIGVEVRRYKNLRDVWIPWHAGSAFFGVNGSGKTNVLECLALLMGTRRTLDLASPRIAQPEPGALALVARPGSAGLPWPAELVLPSVAPLVAAGRVSGVGGSTSVPVMERAAVDAAWWRSLGATKGRTFAAALASADLPALLCAYLVALADDPVVCYRLVELDRSRPAEDASCPPVVRRFERTLMAREVPDDIAGLLGGDPGALPEVLSPLLDSIRKQQRDPETDEPEPLDDEGGGAEADRDARWLPVLRLPDAAEPPAALQWLARARTTDEIVRDLRDALASARRSVDSMAEALDEAVGEAPSRPWRTWLHESGARRARDELRITLPGMSVIATAGDDGFRLVVDPGDGPVELGGTEDADALEYLSSGERRWVDEALATATQELQDLARLASLQSDLIEGVPPGQAGAIDEALRHGGVLRSIERWSSGAFAGVLHSLQPALIASVVGHQTDGVRRPEADPDPTTPESTAPGSTAPGSTMVLVGTQIQVRVFDEPEAHLHPAAQRVVAGAVHRLRAQGANVVIASHSPHFLELPGWATVHVRRGEHGAHVEALPEEWGGAQSLLAKEMGINRGELMAGINAVLVVEGTHDQRMLSRMYGDQLRAAGVATLRMHGTSNLIATVELDLVNRYLDVPMIVLLDYTHVDRVLAGRWETSEERKIAELQRSSRRRQRSFTLLGLHRPDVVCYLNEEALHQRYPSFPGWAPVLERFEATEPRPPFKSWLKTEFAVDITRWRRINQILTIMLARGLPPVEEMTTVVDQVVELVPGPFMPPNRAMPSR